MSSPVSGRPAATRMRKRFEETLVGGDEIGACRAPYVGEDVLLVEAGVVGDGFQVRHLGGDRVAVVFVELGVALGPLLLGALGELRFDDDETRSAQLFDALFQALESAGGQGSGQHDGKTADAHRAEREERARLATRKRAPRDLESLDQHVG